MTDPHPVAPYDTIEKQAARIRELEKERDDARDLWWRAHRSMSKVIFDLAQEAAWMSSHLQPRVPSRCPGYADTIGGGSQVRCGDVEGHEGGHRPRRPGEWEDNQPASVALEQIATHPECARAIYNLAADALCWARKYDEARPANPSPSTTACLVCGGQASKHYGITVSLNPPRCGDCIWVAYLDLRTEFALEREHADNDLSFIIAECNSALVSGVEPIGCLHSIRKKVTEMLAGQETETALNARLAASVEVARHVEPVDLGPFFAATGTEPVQDSDPARGLGEAGTFSVNPAREEAIAKLINTSRRVAMLQPACRSDTASESLLWAEFYEAVNDLARTSETTMPDARRVAEIMLDAAAGDMPEPWRTSTRIMLEEALTRSGLAKLAMRDARVESSTHGARRCHACDQVRTDVGELPNTLPFCAQCSKAHRMGYRCGAEAAALEKSDVEPTFKVDDRVQWSGLVATVIETRTIQQIRLLYPSGNESTFAPSYIYRPVDQKSEVE